MSIYVRYSYTVLYILSVHVFFLDTYIKMHVNAANRLIHLFKCLGAYSKLSHYAVY